MTTNVLFFQKLDKYKKINQPWIFEPFNVPNKKTDAQIVRFSSGEGISSFFFSIFYDHELLKKIPEKRLSFVNKKKESFMKKVESNDLMKYFDYISTRFVNEFDTFLDESLDFDFEQEEDINQSVFEIVRENFIRHREKILIDFQEFILYFKDTQNSELNVRVLEKKFIEFYHDVAQEELNSISLSSDYSEKTKSQFREDIKSTMKKIIELMSEFVLETYMTDLQKENSLTEPNDLFMMYKYFFKNSNDNLLITTMKLSEKGTPDLVLVDTIDFDKHVNTDHFFIVLLYFEDSKSYERLVIESDDSPTDEMKEGTDYIVQKQPKKYTYKYYKFLFQDSLIQKLLNQV